MSVGASGRAGQLISAEKGFELLEVERGETARWVARIHAFAAPFTIERARRIARVSVEAAPGLVSPVLESATTDEGDEHVLEVPCSLLHRSKGLQPVRAAIGVVAAVAAVEARGVVLGHLSLGQLRQAPAGSASPCVLLPLYPFDARIDVAAPAALQATTQPLSPSPRDTVYTMGAVLYRLLTGRAPFEGESAFQRAVAQMTSEPPPLPPGVPARLADVVRASLERAPERRPGTSIEAYASLFADPALEAAAKGLPPPPRAKVVDDVDFDEVIRIAEAQLCRGELARERGLGEVPPLIRWQLAIAYQACASMHRSRGDLEAALTSIEASLRIDGAPDHEGRGPFGPTEARLTRALLLHELGRSTEAEQALSGVDRGLGRARWRRIDASLREARGDTAGALASLDEAIALEPDHAPHWLARSALRHRTRAFEGAVQDASKALSLGHDRREALASRARSLAAMGAYRQALADCREAGGAGGPHPDIDALREAIEGLARRARA